MTGTKSRFGFTWGSSSNTASHTPTERKGEINELKAQLSDPILEKDNTRRRELLKKVIAFMTLGVDTSPLFTQLILACVTKDLVQKKMIYFYLCANSEGNSELAILAINTLQKDCRDESPLVRGLALRSLASFRLPQIAEYLVPTLKNCLADKAPYVRKTAILATLKLFRVAPEAFRTMGLTDKMYGMLRDNDGVVCTNALAVLTEVLEADGGVQVSKSILYFLLNRLRELNEWQQCQVLNLCLKYTPANRDETFDIMNLLEERLLGNNSAVILACSHVFLHLTQNLPDVHQQVFDRLREPLVTLYSTAHNVEISYGVLCHIKLLVEREPKAFQASYKDFFCRFTDPSYIKSIKINLLSLIANEKTAGEIISEFVEYVSDSNPHICKMAIMGIAKVALCVDGFQAKALEHFLELLLMDIEHVRGNTLIAMKDFLRKYNAISTVRPFLEQLVNSYKDVAFEDEESKVALVWVLGEFGEHIKDAPYLIEGMLPLFITESAALRIEILTALMKLFFKRPPEVQPILGKAFSIAINDFSHADVHDRAQLYYRLLKLNPQAAAQVVCVPKQAVHAFVEDDTSDTRDRLFEEFDTMSVIFGQPSAYYVKRVEEDDDSDESENESDDDDQQESVDDDENEAVLLRSNAVEAPVATPTLRLDPDVEIDTNEFKRRWDEGTPTAPQQIRFRTVPDSEMLEDCLSDKNIFTLASGQQGTNLKVYLYSKMMGCEEYFLVELLIQATRSAQVTLRTTNAAAGPAYTRHLLNALGSLIEAA